LLWLGSEHAPVIACLALALTYLAHALAWAAGVGLLVRARTLAPATEHLCWKMALLGPLLSTALAGVLSSSVGRHIYAPYVRDVSVPSFVGAAYTVGTQPDRSPETDAQPSPPPALGRGGTLIVEVCLASAVLGLLRFTGGAWFLGHRLRRRARVTNPELLARLARLLATMGLSGVRLTESGEVNSPLVLGRREICLPCGLPAGLSSIELDSVLAHELAHVERADGVWFPFVGAVQSVLWMNPLNHLLASYFRDSAELACDDRAVEVTGDAMGLARALVQVAEQPPLQRSFGSLPTMLRSKCAIVSRVERLTAYRSAQAALPHSREHAQAKATLALLVGALGALSVQTARATPKSSPAQMKTLSPRAAMAPSSVTGAAAQRALMAELALREQAIQLEMASAERRATTQTEGVADSVRLIELSQELRHVRAKQAWLEARSVREGDSSQLSADH